MAVGRSRSIKVVFSLCSFDGKAVADFVTSFSQTSHLLTTKGVGVSEIWVTGLAYLHLARDLACHAFLKSDGTHMMQIDCDIGWEAGDVLKLLDHNTGFVGGVYCVKQPEPRFMVNVCPGPHKGLVKCHGIPGGFTMVSRETLESMKTPEIEFEDRRFPGETLYGFHSGGIMEKKYWGEDMAFCRRAKEVWADPTIRLRHWDGVRCYDHAFIDALDDFEL